MTTAVLERGQPGRRASAPVIHIWTGDDGAEHRKLEVAIDELGASLLSRDIDMQR